VATRGESKVGNLSLIALVSAFQEDGISALWTANAHDQGSQVSRASVGQANLNFDKVDLHDVGSIHLVEQTSRSEGLVGSSSKGEGIQGTKVLLKKKTRLIRNGEGRRQGIAYELRDWVWAKALFTVLLASSIPNPYLWLTQKPAPF